MERNSEKEKGEKKEKPDFPFWFFSGFVERERGKRKKNKYEKIKA